MNACSGRVCLIKDIGELTVDVDGDAQVRIRCDRSCGPQSATVAAAQPSGFLSDW